ncbi:hypothetical protein AERO8C_20375 [Aeromonas veronii]|uniref:Uncharacterized protein n=1 Tax=Aeromonas veronii TaxID=654 RepID=A0A653L2R7_AERVE|nr:hypothetical protein AERO8C_20375 [Aeromonas veronii]
MSVVLKPIHSYLLTYTAKIALQFYVGLQLTT